MSDQIACEAEHQKNNLNGTYCEPVWDGFLCWPATSTMSVIHLPCPPEKGVDVTKFASRQCDQNGYWVKHPEKENVNGWSNYSNCFTKEIKLLLDKLYTSTESDVQRKIEIAKETRVIEMTGLSISLIFLLISILVFIYFGSLRNKRTQVHKNLFFAMFAQVLIRLILYTDQWLSRESIDDAVTKSRDFSIENAPVLCELFYVLMEYTRTSVFMWMLLEGSHLHNSIVVVFPTEVNFVFFHCIGWGVPLLFISIWASVMAAHYSTTVAFESTKMRRRAMRKFRYRVAVCWWGYALSKYYWILEGPRMCIIAINFVILLNIVCIVLVKVQVNTPSKFQQIRKAVRAALLLLPLLGITNIMDIVPGPIDGTPLEFAIWSYTAHLLSASQGFFISLLYCFLNKEVQEAVRKNWSFCKLSGVLVCWSRHESFPARRIRPVTEEKEISRNEVKVCSEEPNSIL